MRIDHRQSFLLATPYKLRPVDLNSVDVYGVFIKRASTHRILRTHLIVGVHSRHCGDHGFHTSSRHVGRQFERLSVEGLHAVDIIAETHYLKLPQVHSKGIQPDIERKVSLRTDKLMGNGLEAYATIHHLYRVLLCHGKRVHTFEVGIGAYCRISHTHGRKFHRFVLTVYDLA